MAKIESTGDYGIERKKDLPWNDKKVSIFRALKALKATNASGAVTAKRVAEKAGVDPTEVRHYCYHARVSGLCDVAIQEGVKGYSFYLTAKGASIDPVKELKAQEAAKKEAEAAKASPPPAKPRAKKGATVTAATK